MAFWDLPLGLDQLGKLYMGMPGPSCRHHADVDYIYDKVEGEYLARVVHLM